MQVLPFSSIYDIFSLMNTVLSIVQIVLSVVLVVAILLQNSESGLGSAFGGNDGGPSRTRRGSEKTIFNAAIVIAIAFVIVSFIVFTIS